LRTKGETDAPYKIIVTLLFNSVSLCNLNEIVASGDRGLNPVQPWLS
jgi:hypothetical protein